MFDRIKAWFHPRPSIVVSISMTIMTKEEVERVVFEGIRKALKLNDAEYDVVRKQAYQLAQRKDRKQ